MKKVLVTIVLAIFVIVSASAQTQSGYVKTKGRMDSKGNLIPGTRIGGAAITLTGGHSTVADANGDFTLAVPDNKFFLKNVQKQGYVLVDPDVLSKQYVLSANPLVFTMVTPKQQLEDQIEAQKKIEATLREQLVQREKDLEALKKAHKLTEEDYYQQLQQLYDEKATQELVKEMSKRYSEIDYDLIDSFQRQFSTFILNGELAKADSLLKTKGNLTGDIKELHRLETANAVERVELERRRARLDTSVAYAQWLMEDIAMRCENKVEIFKLRYQNDSAAYYLELRANLDTTNVYWQHDAGDVLKDDIKDYYKALHYYQRALRHAVKQCGNEIMVALSYEAIGDVNLLIHVNAHDFLSNKQYYRTLENYEKALDIYIKIFKEGHPSIARSYHKLASLYSLFRKNEDAIICYQKELNEDRKIYGEESADVATDFFNLGYVYEEMGMSKMSLDYYQKAISVCKNSIEKLQKNNDDILEIADNLFLLGNIYSQMHEYQHAIDSYNATLALYKNGTSDTQIKSATIYDEMSGAYWQMKEYDKSFNCLHQKLKIYQNSYGDNHLKIAEIYVELGQMHSSIDEDTIALKCYLKELEILMKVYGDLNHRRIVVSYCHIANQYDEHMGNYLEAEKYRLKALEIQKNITGENSADYADLLSGLGGIFIDIDNQKTIAYYNKALGVYKETLGDYHYKVGSMYSSIADVYRRMNNYPKSLDYEQKSLIVSKRIFEADTSSRISCHVVGFRCEAIAGLCADFEDYEKAIEYYHEAIVFYKKYDVYLSSMLRCYMELGDICFMKGNYSKSLEYYQNILDILKTSNKEDVKSKYEVRSNFAIAKVHYAQRDYVRTLEYCQKTLAILVPIHGEESSDAAVVYSLIARAYYYLRNYDKSMFFYQKSLSIYQSIYGIDHQQTKIIADNLRRCKIDMIIHDPKTMQQYAFTINIDDGETPAKAQGLSGEYVVLEFGDWSIDSTSSLYDVNEEMRGEPKTILIMKDDVISQHSFENSIGAMIKLKQVGEAEKNRIKELYHRWKRESNR